jgi:hypothetical protein
MQYKYYLTQYKNVLCTIHIEWQPAVGGGGATLLQYFGFGGQKIACRSTGSRGVKGRCLEGPR